MRTDYGFLGAGIYFSDNLCGVSNLTSHKRSLHYRYASIKYTSFKDNPQATPASRFALVAMVALGNMKDYMSITPDLESPPGTNSKCSS